MRRILILDDIKDAAYAAKNRNLFMRDDTMILSTHISVEVFLKEKFRIECRSLCRFMQPSQTVQNIKLSDRLANEIVDLLDHAHSGQINKKAGLNGIRFFRALYSYPIYYQLINFLNVYDALNNVLKMENVGEILFFDKKVNEYYGSRITLRDILRVFPDIKLTSIINDAEVQAQPRNMSAMRWQKAVNYPGLTALNVLSRFKEAMTKIRCSNIIEGRKTIMIFEPLYELSFLPEHLLSSGFNVLSYNFDFTVAADDGYRLTAKDEASGVTGSGGETGYQSYFKAISIKDVEKTFNDNLGRYLGYLKELSRLDDKYNIRLGVWGVSPTRDLASLASEYLLRKKKPVIGMQHGGLMGNLNNSDVCLTDLDRCSDFISYGFNKSDLKKTYPEKNFDRLTIHEFGTMKAGPRGRAKRRSMRLLFPVTNTISMLGGGMIRDMPDTLLDNQFKLIEYLDNVTDHEIVVKPFPFSNYDNLAIMPILEKAKRVKVINSLSFEDAINLYKVDAVLLEHATTTLYEALDPAYDMEIFLVNHNEVRPIEELALGELKRRVHYAENADDIIPKLKLFFDGKLERKRDNTFYDHYIYRENTKQKISDIVDKLVNS